MTTTTESAPRYVDMTPTFAESARMLCAILQNGNAKGKEWAYTEIARWGQMLDGAKEAQTNAKGAAILLLTCLADNGEDPDKARLNPALSPADVANSIALARAVLL